MSRFKVVKGGGKRERPAAKINGGTVIEAHACGPCSDRVGYLYDRLTLIRTGAIVSRGDILGGEDWWACAGCGKPYYRAGG